MICRPIRQESSKQQTIADVLESGFISRHDFNVGQKACNELKDHALAKKEAAEAIEKQLASLPTPPNLYTQLQSQNSDISSQAEKQSKQLKTYLFIHFVSNSF